MTGDEPAATSTGTAPPGYGPRALAALTAALATGVASMAALRALPFLTRLSALQSVGATTPPSVMAAFLVAAFIFGASVGLLTLIPLRWARGLSLAFLISAAAVALVVVSLVQTVHEMNSGDSLLAALLISPIALGRDVLYALLVALVATALFFAANAINRLLRELAVAQLGLIAAGAGVVTLLLVVPLARGLGGAPPAPDMRRELPSPSPPVTPACDDVPLATLAKNLPGVGAVSLRRVAETHTLEVYVAGTNGAFQEGGEVQAILPGGGACRDAGGVIWQARIVPAATRELILHVAAQTKPGQKRDDFAGWLASTVRSTFTNLVQPEPGETGRFFTSVAEALSLVPGARLRCEPAAPDLICDVDKIAIAQPGVIPLLKRVVVER
jgi:hypothetical protein